jgi:drug/metabolite transporter (DMT)-like permease
LQTTTEIKQSNKALIAWALLILLACVWGTSFILVKKSLAVFTPFQIGAFRIAMAGLVFLPWAILFRKQYPQEKTKYFISSGLLGYLLPAFLFAYAGSKINSSLSGTLNSATPLFVLIVGAIFFQQSIKFFQVLGLILGFIGSLLLILVGKSGGLSFDNPWALLVILAALMYGFNVNIVGKFLKDVNPLLSSTYTLVSVGIVAMILLFSTDFFQRISLPDAPKALFYMTILGALGSGLMAFVFNYLVQIASPIFASSVTYLIPIVAMFNGFLDGEAIFPLHYVGMCIILVGVWLINKK